MTLSGLSVVDQIADAAFAVLTADRDGGVFSADVERLDMPRKKAEELRELGRPVVIVVPRRLAGLAPIGRAVVMGEYGIDIAVQAWTESPTPEHLQPLRLLAEYVAERFRPITGNVGRSRLTVAAGVATWTRTDVEALPDSDHLEAMGVFTAVAAMTFKLSR